MIRLNFMDNIHIVVGQTLTNMITNDFTLNAEEFNQIHEFLKTELMLNIVEAKE